MSKYLGKPSFNDLKNCAAKLGYKMPENTKRITVVYDAKIKSTNFIFETK